MDETVSASGGGGRIVAPRPAAGSDMPEARPVPRPPERARYRPLRGLEELLDDVLGGPSEPG